MFSLHHAHPLLSCTWIRNCLSCVRNVSPTYRPRLASSSWQKPSERTRVQFNPNYWRVTPPVPVDHVYGICILHATVAYNPTSPMHHLYSRRIASNLLSQYKERGSFPRLITSQGTGLLSEQSLMAFWARTCVPRWQQLPSEAIPGVEWPSERQRRLYTSTSWLAMTRCCHQGPQASWTADRRFVHVTIPRRWLLQMNLQFHHQCEEVEIEDDARSHVDGSVKCQELWSVVFSVYRF